MSSKNSPTLRQRLPLLVAMSRDNSPTYLPMQYYLQPIPAPSPLRKNPCSQSPYHDLPLPLPPAIKPPNPPPKLCRYPPSPNPATPRSPSGVLTSAFMASQPVFEGLFGEDEGSGRGRGMCLGGGGEVVGGVGSGIEGVSAGRVMVASGSPMPSSSHVWGSSV